MATAIKLTAPSLEAIIGQNVAALFRRFHLNRDVIIGLVGDRGSGKSLGGANISLRDYGFSQEPIFSNMQMALNINVPDAVANIYGIHGGQVKYTAETVDKQTFLQLDERYEGGCFFFDEFNLEYGEARRSAANVNLMTDRAIQQLRKLQCALIYTVIDEMYVDVRIRDNTDMFIRCIDTAFKPENLRNKMQQGVAFEWTIYPMSVRLFGIGNTYTVNKKPIGPIPVVLKDMWGSIDTMERQAVGQTKYSQAVKTLLPVEMTEDPRTIRRRDKTAWLDERLKTFFDNHANDGDEIEIPSSDFRQELGIAKSDWPNTVKLLYELLPNLDTKGAGSKHNPTRYIMPNRILIT